MGGKGGGGVGSAATRAGASQFWSSNPARRASFKALAEALATGGRGMRTGFVHGAIARSREMGTQALRNAAGGMSGVDPSIVDQATLDAGDHRRPFGDGRVRLFPAKDSCR